MSRTSGSRRELLKAAGAMVAALPLAALGELPIGRRGRRAMAAGLPRVHPGDVPDVVLLNARVRTLDASGRTAEAVAIKHGRILAVVHDGRPSRGALPQREARGFAVPDGCHCPDAGAEGV